MKAVFLQALQFYRDSISPYRPNYCRFIPSCSAYAMEAVEKYGAAKGSYLAARRLMRCHPFHRNDGYEYDPVP